MQAAFGNSFEESLNRRNQFNLNRDHWHHMVRVEFEHWFSVSGWKVTLRRWRSRPNTCHPGTQRRRNRPDEAEALRYLHHHLGRLDVPVLALSRQDLPTARYQTPMAASASPAGWADQPTSGGVSGGACACACRSGNIECTGGLWYLPVLRSEHFPFDGVMPGVVSTSSPATPASLLSRILPEALCAASSPASMGYDIRSSELRRWFTKVARPRHLYYRARCRFGYSTG